MMRILYQSILIRALSDTRLYRDLVHAGSLWDR